MTKHDVTFQCSLGVRHNVSYRASVQNAAARCPMFRCGVRLPLPAYIRRCVRLPRPAPIIVMVIVLSVRCQSLLLQAIPNYRGSPYLSWNKFILHQPIPNYRGRPMHSSIHEARQANICHVIPFVCGTAFLTRTLATQLAELGSWGKAPGTNGGRALRSAEMLFVVVLALCLARPSS